MFPWVAELSTEAQYQQRGKTAKDKEDTGFASKPPEGGGGGQGQGEERAEKDELHSPLMHPRLSLWFLFSGRTVHGFCFVCRLSLLSSVPTECKPCEGRGSLLFHCCCLNLLATCQALPNSC